MDTIELKPHTDEQVFLDKFSLTSFICSCVREKIDIFLDKEPGLKASPTSFSTRKLARVFVQQRTLDKGIFVYVLNSSGLVKVVRKKILSNFAYTGINYSCNLSRKTCSSYRRVSELVKKLVKENLLVCTGLNTLRLNTIRLKWKTGLFQLTIFNTPIELGVLVKNSSAWNLLVGI